MQSEYGDICFDQVNAQKLYEREILLQGALDKCNLTIEQYNATR